MAKKTRKQSSSNRERVPERRMGGTHVVSKPQTAKTTDDKDG